MSSPHSPSLKTPDSAADPTAETRSPAEPRLPLAIDPRQDLLQNPTRCERFLTLPNGLEIGCQSQMEADHIWEDLFEKRIYLRNGISLWDGATVVDVGGNIGLFSVFCHLNYRDVTTYTFEPAPPLFEILRTNLGRYATGKARIFHCGVSEGFDTATLTFYPYSSGMSSFYADEEEEKEVLKTIMDHQAKEGMEGMAEIMESSQELLDARFTSHTFDCPLIPLERVFAEHQVGTVDLLKVDVQKAELDVLRGVGEEDWPRVRQVVGEVHDLEGRLDAVLQLLERHGFDVVTEQDDILDGSVLYNFFAVSRSLYRGAEDGGDSRRARSDDRARRQRQAMARRRQTQRRQTQRRGGRR
ncbi:MAG: FkbM family methyltransferase [Acidobacteriota bacterium]